MLYPDKIISALEKCRSDYALFKDELAGQMDDYRKALSRAAELSCSEILSRLRSHSEPGALPSPELDRSRSFIIPFGIGWENHEEARTWACDTLMGRTTFAADGSQIMPTKDFSVPVAAVQVAWFENPHLKCGAYTKDACFEVISPSELSTGDGGNGALSEQIVHRRRYSLEAKALKEYMRKAAGDGYDPDKPPVVFFDSSLIISFADAMPPDQKDFYVGEILDLLDCSKRTGIPIVGYIDSSYARDLVNMVAALSELAPAEHLHDGALIGRKMKWGDRTAFFTCARRGILSEYGERWNKGIGFVYLKTSGDAPPSRLDIPVWVYEQGLIDYVADTVRGEAIAGNGYPYAIETADAAAVVMGRDREMFYALFQEFADREGLGLHIAHKARSKALRRI